jgi:hypothetical protein
MYQDVVSHVRGVQSCDFLIIMVQMNIASG